MKRAVVLNGAQKQLVAGHVGVVKWAIYEHIRVNEHVFGLSHDDLYQEGCLYLCHAAATYNGERAQFETYAQVVVKNGLLSYCKKMCGKQKHVVSMGDMSWKPDGDGNDRSGNPDESVYETMLSDAAVFGLLESVKTEYSGVARLGIEALELKVKGYTGAEIA